MASSGKESDKETSSETWALSLAEYIRNNDQSLLESGEKLLCFYEQDLLPTQSFYEFCDVIQILDIIPEPHHFLENALKIPTS